MPPTRPLLISSFNILCKLYLGTLRTPFQVFNASKTVILVFFRLNLDFSIAIVALRYISHQKQIYFAFPTLAHIFNEAKTR